MKVFITGATGVMGMSAVRAFLEAGHDVGGLVRGEDKAAALARAGATPFSAQLFDADALASAFAGYEVVCNLATHIPVGLIAGARPGAWRVNDRIRSEGSRVVAQAAARAGVTRLIQESTSQLYQCAGDDWIDERSPLTVTRATEPNVLAETHALAFDDSGGTGLVLRFGQILGDDPMSRWLLARARSGAPVGVGDPQGWAHVIHRFDVGCALVAALRAAGGVYNVGADPVRRGELTAGVFQAAGKRRAAYLPKMLVRLGGERMEPLTRSHRISSRRFRDETGWRPVYPSFDGGWLAQPQPA